MTYLDLANDPEGQGSGECYRCGYNLHGVAGDQACPECGLLAERSRRVTDALHDTRPGWLRRLAWGVRFILLAVVVGMLGPLLGASVAAYFWNGANPWNPERFLVARHHGAWVGIDLAAVLLLAGVVLLTSAEGYPPADAADARRRRWMRALAVLPLLALAVQHVLVQRQIDAMSADWYRLTRAGAADWLVTAGYALLAFALAPLALLLFFQLRSLARRARSAHLAEHCAIVGVGNALALLYVVAALVVLGRPELLGLSNFWSVRSPVALGVVASLGAAAALFGVWNVYLLVRFSVAFGSAARKQRRAWRSADRSQPLTR